MKMKEKGKRHLTKMNVMFVAKCFQLQKFALITKNQCIFHSYMQIVSMPKRLPEMS